MISQNFVRKDMKKSVIFSVLRRDRYRKDDQHKKSYNGNFDLMLYRNPMEANGNEISLLGSQKLQELPIYQPFYKKPSKWTIQFRNYHQFVNKFDNFQLIQNHRRIWIYFTFKTWYLRFNIIGENAYYVWGSCDVFFPQAQWWSCKSKHFCNQLEYAYLQHLIKHTFWQAKKHFWNI